MTPIRFQGENPKVYYEFDRDSALLGSGGMGYIYQGYRVDMGYNIQSIVAIKCIKPELSSNASIIQRAQREASVQIDHPNLIRMYGFFSGAEYNQLSGTYVPSYYVAMERLVGVNLDEVLFKGITSDKTGMQIPLAEELYQAYENDRTAAVVSVMKEILKGVSALHDAGYIHRDIDPSNVMLTIDGHIKIIDFGISKPINSTSFGGGLTHAGQFLGKMAYAAPELIIGDLASQGLGVDIYALGIVFYQLLTGYLPVSGNDQEVMNAHLSGKIDYKDIENAAVRKIIEKATRKDISSRYSSVEQMLEALNAVELNSDKPKVKVDKPAKVVDFPTNPRLIGVAALIGLIIGVGLQFLI